MKKSTQKQNQSNRVLDNKKKQAELNRLISSRLVGLLTFSQKRGSRTKGVDLAQFLDVKEATVSAWTTGKSAPETRHIPSIADYFGVTCDYLLGVEISGSRETTDICEATPLLPAAASTLSEYNSCGCTYANDLSVRALNHIVENCNQFLNIIGQYLFGQITGVNKVQVDKKTYSQPDEIFRNGLLKTLELTLQNYRKLLVDNGGDLPQYRGVIEAQRKHEKELVEESMRFHNEALKKGGDTNNA